MIHISKTDADIQPCEPKVQMLIIFSLEMESALQTLTQTPPLLTKRANSP